MNPLVRTYWLFYSANGRLSRMPYALGFLAQLALLVFPFYRIVIVDDRDPTAPTWALILLLIFVPTMASMICLTAKRLHDIGRTAFAAIFIVVPVVSLVIFLVLCVIAGDAAANSYGKRTNDFG